MAVFAYKGRTGTKTVAGQLDAPDRREALALLRARGIVATSVEARGERRAARAPDRRVDRRAKAKDLALYTRQFSTMVDAGLPLAQVLSVLGEQSESKPLRAVTAVVTGDVTGGTTLADALRRHPRTFDDVFVNLVEAGEAAGALDVVLRRLSTYIEKAAHLKSKVKSAMAYPVAVLAVAGLVVVAMLAFVIPTFAKMFTDLGAALPLPTRMVMGLSDLVVGYGHYLALGAGALVWGLRRYKKTAAGGRAIDRLLLRLPIFGVLVRKVAVARFTRTLGTLVSSGVSILEALRVTARAAGNLVVEDAVLRARADVITGQPLAGPLAATGVFPPMVVHMISVGEATGKLDDMLGKIADFYEEEVDTAVATLTSLMEPVMIVLLGGIIGGLVVAMYLPIFRMILLVK